MLYIARQPIFDRQRRVRAYELLFRSSMENRCTAGDTDLAGKSSLDTAVLIGLDRLSEGRDLFLNCTSETILAGFAMLFPPATTVLEILETVEPNGELVSACEELKRAGYRIALDDYVDDLRWSKLVKLADVVKIDLRTTARAQWRVLSQKYRSHSRRMLAEKVETYEEFESAHQCGFDLFQGYFFCRPKILSTQSVPLHGNLGIILRSLGKSELNLFELEQAIKAEPALCYRLLRYLNSPAFYVSREIRSILHALTLLGEQKVRRWLLLVCAVMGASAGNSAVVVAALVRARFCELLGPMVGVPEYSLFMLGLLSLMDAVLGIDGKVLMQQVSVNSEVKNAFFGKPSKLRSSFELAVAYEMAEWNECDCLCAELHVSGNSVRQAYLEAVGWSRQLCEVTFSGPG